MQRALAFCALSCATALGLAAAPALASGPGVRLISHRDAAAVVDVSGAQIDAAADVRSRSYTLRSSPGSAGRKLTLTGLSIRDLLLVAGFDPDTVPFILIARDDGSLATLRRADFAGRPPFPEGPALVTDEGATTRFFRPVRGPTSVNGRDNILVSNAAGPLDMTVGGGALLAVRAGARPRRTAVGRAVRFSARVRFAPAGAALTYEWRFGDGTSGLGADVRHAYTEEDDFQAQVTVRGSGGTGRVCEETCGGVASVNVRVGRGRASPRPGAGAGSASADPDGSAQGGSGSGAGGRGGRGRESAAQARGAARGRGEAGPRADPGATIQGILLASSPNALTNSLPALRRAGGQTAATRAASRGARGAGKLGGSLALTLMLIALGALYERRRGTLRLA